MKAIRALDGSFSILGRRLPRVVALIMALTFGFSVIAALAVHAGLPLALVGALSPAAVWEGQVWRLVTWVFFETSPIGLVFALLVLWWFGPDLAHAWGRTRFLAVYLGFAAFAGTVTVALAGTVWPGLMNALYAGSTGVTGALIIAWAVLFPHRQILVYFLFPLGGRNLIYLTLGITVLYAVFAGPSAVLPQLVAELSMLVYVREPTLYRFWMRLRMAAAARPSVRRPSHLRSVDRGDDERPRWLH